MINVTELRDKLNKFIDEGYGDRAFLIESKEDDGTIYAIFAGADVYFDEYEGAVVAYERYSAYGTAEDE